MRRGKAFCRRIPEHISKQCPDTLPQNGGFMPGIHHLTSTRILTSCTTSRPEGLCIMRLSRSLKPGPGKIHQNDCRNSSGQPQTQDNQNSHESRQVRSLWFLTTDRVPHIPQMHAHTCSQIQQVQRECQEYPAHHHSPYRNNEY